MTIHVYPPPTMRCWLYVVSKSPRRRCRASEINRCLLINLLCKAVLEGAILERLPTRQHGALMRFASAAADALFSFQGT